MSSKVELFLKNRTGEFQRLLDLNAPEVILARQLVLMWEAATAAFGKILYEALAEREIINARKRYDLCQNCDAEVPVSTAPELCLPCQEIEYREIDKLIGDDELYELEEK